MRRRLDRQIVAGDVGDEAREVALRARQLTDPRSQRAAARSLRRVVEHVDVVGSRPDLSAVVVDRAAVRSSRQGLLGLADRLERARPVSPRGMVLVADLITDGAAAPCIAPAAGELWRPRSAGYPTHWAPSNSDPAGAGAEARPPPRTVRIARWVRHHLVLMGPELSPWSLRAGRPSPTSGIVVAVACVGLATLVIYPLSQVAPVVSLSVVYLPGVVVVSAYWGLRLGLVTAIGSAAAFNFFHLAPVGTFTLGDRRDWAALAAFVVIAVATGLIAELARTRAQEADERRREADLAAELAQVLLGGLRVDEALALAAKRLAAAIGVDAAALELAPVTPTDRQVAFALGNPAGPGGRIGTLVLPNTLSMEERKRVAARVVPALESILSAALHRATLQAEVVETTALRRSDEMKTAILRSVSHDLRTPVTAILTAASALDPERSTPEDVGEVRDVVTHAGRRLARLIEKVLDLTMLQSGTLEPRRDWYSIEEVLSEATAGLDAAVGMVHTSVDPDIPLLQGDAGQLERAFGNLLENAVRYSGGQPVVVLVRTAGSRVRVRIVDQGPGISAQEQERIFLPFYRSSDHGSSHDGSGLGLAIAKGFIHAGGGEIGVESLPGQGTSFVVELPVSAAAADIDASGWAGRHPVATKPT